MIASKTSKLFSNKRGYTYIIVTTLIIIVLLTVFFSGNVYKYQDAEASQQIRIRAMNDFMRNLDTDIHRATYISAFRAMLALEDSVTTSGVYLTDMNSSFRETFFYGTINDSTSLIMENSSFSDYLLKVQDLSKTVGITLDINVTSIRLVQSNPWSIDVYMLMDITATDVKRTASWNISREYMTNIPIINLRDPVYSKNTLNRLPNTIRKLNDSDLVVGYDTSRLKEHINGSYYIASTDAPSFIMRFTGSTASDPNGIESIVDIQALSDQDIEVYYAKVKIDYIYFSNISTDKVCGWDEDDIPAADYFVIPSNRLALYTVTGLNYSMTCP